MSEAVLRLWPSLPKATINPNIHGHFAEHLGRCVHEGIWTGPGSPIPNHEGMRLDVLAALKHLRAPVLRWPGGCFADNYDWADGIGPVEDRPSRVNLWWKQTEPNSFGTDEFMRLCQEVGCAPYLCCNVGTGTPEQALRWLEYCNFGGDSTLTRQRAQNGHPPPYGVKYWGVGNETWGCGGRFRPEDYAKEYVRYASYLRAFDPSIELVAAGTAYFDYKNPTLNVWNHNFCEEMYHPDLIDHLSIHRYFTRGKALDCTQTEFQSLFADVTTLERDLRLTQSVLEYFYPDRFVGIVVDEWGMWHPEATEDNGLEQRHPLRDALLGASVLNLLNQWAHRVTMANLAQTVNVLQSLACTRGASMYLTPTYHVFDLFRPHQGGRLLTQELECGAYEAHAIGQAAKQSVPLLSASASMNEAVLTVTLVNQSWDTDVATSIEVRESSVASVTARILHQASPFVYNDFDAPNRVTPQPLTGIEVDGGAVRFTLPRYAVVALTIILA